jgi:hypothetical protein
VLSHTAAGSDDMESSQFPDLPAGEQEKEKGNERRPSFLRIQVGLEWPKGVDTLASQEPSQLIIYSLRPSVCLWKAEAMQFRQLETAGKLPRAWLMT